VAVLTSERILLFHAESWSLMLEDDLESLVEVVLPPLSDVFLILRRPTGDLLLELSRRSLFLTELQDLRLATEPLPVRVDAEILVAEEPLSKDGEEWRRAVVAFVQKEAFLMLEHKPESLLICGETFFYGFLLVQVLATEEPPQTWKWMRCFAILKTARRLVWTLHPTDSEPLGDIETEQAEVEPLPHPSDETMFSVSATSGDQEKQRYIFKAVSLRIRDEWIVSIRTLQE
jgi:hypothetical protein